MGILQEEGEGKWLGFILLFPDCSHATQAQDFICNFFGVEFGWILENPGFVFLLLLLDEELVTRSACLHAANRSDREITSTEA